MRLARGMALAIVLFIAGASAAQAIEITEEVFGNYQKYLKTIGSTRKGAFAVEEDGYSSYFTYCSDPSCISTSLTQEALNGCAALDGHKCVILAYGREERLPFTVVSRRKALSSEDPILANILSEDQLKALVVGNTMQGEYLNHKKWVEYYAPDGTLRGRADSWGSMSGRYEVKGKSLCFSYDGHSDWNWCVQYSVSGGNIRLVDENGKLVTNQVNIEVLQGNPDNL